MFRLAVKIGVEEINPQRLFLECVDKKDAGALREFLRLLFSLILKYYNSCDLSTKIDKILNLFAG